jgi:hypothetical protein
MEKKLLEVEGDEMAIFSTTGIMAIIPKNKVNWVKKKLNEGCHECIDSLVQSLPDYDNRGQKAAEGIMLDLSGPPVEEGGPGNPNKGTPQAKKLSLEEWKAQNPNGKVLDLRTEDGRNAFLKQNLPSNVRDRYLKSLNQSLNSNYTWDNLPAYVCDADGKTSLFCGGPQTDMVAYNNDEIGNKTYTWKPNGKPVVQPNTQPTPQVTPQLIPEPIPQPKPEPNPGSAGKPIGEVNNEIIQVRETQNNARQYSDAVQNANPGMATPEYATEVRIGTARYPVRHSNDKHYGEVIVDGKKKYIIYKKIENGTSYGYEPVITDSKPITF